MERLPTSLLISTHPSHALRLSRTPPKKRSNSNGELYGRPIPPSKRPRRNHPTNNPNHSSPSTTHSVSTTTNSSPPDQHRINTNTASKNNATADPLVPALPHLPPTPLTPHEIIQSSTLSRLFRNSNTVFSQIADSATGLIQTDLAIGNKLTQLTELLRGDLNSRSSVQLVQQHLEQQQPTDTTADTSQYQILTQTLHVVQSLFISSTPVRIPINSTSDPSTKKNTNSNQQVEEQTNENTKLIDVEEQNEIYQTSIIQINKFLGDLKDYRDRLMELRNGCLGIEKRRKAIWYLIKISSLGFDEILASSSLATTGLNDDAHQVESSTSLKHPIINNHHLNVNKKRLGDDRRSESDSDRFLLHHHHQNQQHQLAKQKQVGSEDESTTCLVPDQHRPPPPTTTTSTAQQKKLVSTQQQKIKKNTTSTTLTKKNSSSVILNNNKNQPRSTAVNKKYSSPPSSPNSINQDAASNSSSKKTNPNPNINNNNNMNVKNKKKMSGLATTSTTVDPINSNLVGASSIPNNNFPFPNHLSNLFDDHSSNLNLNLTSNLNSNSVVGHNLVHHHHQQQSSVLKRPSSSSSSSSGKKK